MDAARWQQLERWFAEALELPAERRAAFCAAAAAGDDDLRDDLLGLLRAHDTEASLLDAPPQLAVDALPPSDAAAAGLRLGVWRVGSLIRRGGSGEVYFATRADGAFDQRVAVKLLYRESTPDVQRFHAERQILAGLEHPGIARLLDGGVSDSGRLYAVVEYVDGEPLTDYCRRRRADLHERLSLFRQVCDVVAYAHRSLIVHRDLKPGNILVTGDGRIKLLDFGVAKRLDPAAAGGDITNAPYTPDYAAPEQLTGQAVTTATDVYALGVLLFELLAGDRPWKSDDLPIARIVQLIVHDEPPRPSATAVRSAAPPVPARLIEGDLDAIVATCLRKEAGDRYPTVDALAGDIDRHLASEPVTARGRSRSYVLGRALRRHRWAVAAGALVFASLAGGLAATVWQARRAEIERDVARRAATREEAVRYYLTNMFRSSIAKDASGAATPGSGPVTAKTMLDRSAQRVLQQYREDPQLAGKVVVTLSDLYGALEDVEGQAPLLEGFLAAAGPEADAEAVALARQKLAYIELLRGHLPRAALLLPQAEALWATAPGRYHEQHLEALFVRAMLQRNQGDLAGSIDTYRAAITERTAFSGDVHRETANLYNSLAITLTAANRLDEALAAYASTLAIYAKLGQADDLDALVILGNTGTLAYRMGKLREAEQILKTAYEKQQERAGDSAAVAASMSLYGAALAASGRNAEAIAVLEPAAAMADKFVGAASPLALQARVFLVDALAASGAFGRAGEVAAASRTLAAQRFGEAGLLTLRVRIGQARLRLESGEPAAAAAEFAALVEPLGKLGRPAQPALAHALFGRGEALLAMGRPAEAIEPLRQAMALREQLLWSGSWELALARERLGEALKQSRQPGGGSLLEQAATTLAAQLGEGHAQVQRARRAMAAPA